MSIPKLPEAELEIMKIIWQYERGGTSAQIMEKLEGKKEWAVTTVLNFLARLVDRGFLSVQRNGKTNTYTSIIDEEKYLARESKTFFERLHDSSLKSLFAALYDGATISQDDLDEMKRYIDQKAGESR